MLTNSYLSDNDESNAEVIWNPHQQSNFEIVRIVMLRFDLQSYHIADPRSWASAAVELNYSVFWVIRRRKVI